MEDLFLVEGMEVDSVVVSPVDRVRPLVTNVEDPIITLEIAKLRQ